jgi:hypothetical protein
MTKILLALSIGVLALGVGCGKKQILPKNGSPEEPVEPFNPEIEKQRFFCDKKLGCPSYILKILVNANGKRRVCTGTLVGQKTVVTSASCIPSKIRSEGIDCKDDVFLFLPHADDESPRIIGCKKILQVSDLSEPNPVYWREDVAFIEIDRTLYWNRKLAISKEGLWDDVDFESFSVEQTGEFDAYLRPQRCRPVYRSYINPLASHPSSPNMVMAGCDFYNGSIGAPILDKRDGIRGITSKPLSENMRTWINNSGMILGEPLLPITHVSNFACAATPWDSTMMSARECSKPLNDFESDSLRKEILDPEDLFKRSVYDSERNLPSNYYLEFGVRMVPQANYFVTEFYPKCFRNTGYWVKKMRDKNQYSVAQKFTPSVLKKMIDSSGRIRAFEEKGAEKTYRVYFGPKDLYNLKKSTVTILDGEDRSSFGDITACE